MKYKLLNFIRQFALILLVIWTVVSLVTLLIEFVPGSPATAILGETATAEQIANFNAKHGLDKPAFFVSYGDSGLVWNGLNNRYADYWTGLVQGDLGRSFRTDRPVLDMILERYPATHMIAVQYRARLAETLIAAGDRAAALAEIESILAEPEQPGTREFHVFARELREKALTSSKPTPSR